MGILSWDKPPKVMTTEEWQSISADSAPPGVYVPNMSAADVAKWKAKLVGKTTDRPQVEIRKDSTVIVVSLGNGYRYKYYDVKGPTAITLHIGSAGPIQWSFDDLAAFNEAISEARVVLEGLRK